MYSTVLKGHSYENICTIIALNYSLGPPMNLNFLKSPLKKLQFFYLSILRNKMGCLDLEDLATSRLQLCKRH
jgi:hypothetical protein